MYIYIYPYTYIHTYILITTCMHAGIVDHVQEMMPRLNKILREALHGADGPLGGLTAAGMIKCN